MRYVAIKIQNKPIPAGMYINEFYRFACNNNGFVYFPTDIRFNFAKGVPEKLILFFEMGSPSSPRMMYVVGDICSALNHNSSGGVVVVNGERVFPVNVRNYCPPRCSAEPKRTWFLLKNLCLVEEHQLSGLYVVDTNNLGGYIRFVDELRRNRKNPRIYAFDGYGVHSNDLIKF